MAVTYVDVSSHQDVAGVNLRAHYNAGYRYLMIKATEGIDYAFDHMQAWAQLWHSFGPDAHVGYYHWLYGTLSGQVQFDWFWKHVAPVIRLGDWTMTDFEDVDPARWVTDTQHAQVLRVFTQAAAGKGNSHHIYAPNWYVANLPECIDVCRLHPVVASDYSHPSPPPNPYRFNLVAHQFTDRLQVAGFPQPVDGNTWLTATPASPHPSTNNGTPTGQPDSEDLVTTQAEFNTFMDNYMVQGSQVGLDRIKQADDRSELPIVAALKALQESVDEIKATLAAK